jgi:hypothetical protein
MIMPQVLEDRLPRGTFFADLEGSQFSAIRHSVRLGRALQNTSPQMAEDYRDGKSLKEIAKSYDISQTKGIAESTAIEAVRYALSGYHSNFGFLGEQDYDGLIPQDEYTNLAKQHHSNNALKIDEQMKKENRGIYGIPSAQRTLAGQKGARNQIEKKIGIHAQTFEDHQELGRLGAEALGHTIWSDDEKLSALDMATQPGKEYQRGSRIAIGKIASELNDLYHEGNSIRTARAVGKFLSDYDSGLRQ